MASFGNNALAGLLVQEDRKKRIKSIDIKKQKSEFTGMDCSGIEDMKETECDMQRNLYLLS